MKLMSLTHLAIGVLLSGCTYNTNVRTEINNHTQVFSYAVDNEGALQERTEITTAMINKCGVYEPPAAPAPVQVDLKRLEMAKTDSEVNRILLDNIAKLNKQMRAHKDHLKEHRKQWVQKCQVQTK